MLRNLHPGTLSCFLSSQRYRKLVLEKHPDKQPGNKRAAEEFIKIQRAYEIITDDKARDAWAALQRYNISSHAELYCEHPDFKLHNEDMQTILHLVLPQCAETKCTLKASASKTNDRGSSLWTFSGQSICQGTVEKTQQHKLASAGQRQHGRPSMPINQRNEGRWHRTWRRERPRTRQREAKKGRLATSCRCRNLRMLQVPHSQCPDNTFDCNAYA